MVTLKRRYTNFTVCFQTEQENSLEDFPLAEFKACSLHFELWKKKKILFSNMQHYFFSFKLEWMKRIQPVLSSFILNIVENAFPLIFMGPQKDSLSSCWMLSFQLQFFFAFYEGKNPLWFILWKLVFVLEEGLLLLLLFLVLQSNNRESDP